jgi:hypothetical protein
VDDYLLLLLLTLGEGVDDSTLLQVLSELLLLRFGGLNIKRVKVMTEDKTQERTR